MSDESPGEVPHSLSGSSDDLTTESGMASADHGFHGTALGWRHIEGLRSHESAALGRDTVILE